MGTQSEIKPYTSLKPHGRLTNVDTVAHVFGSACATYRQYGSSACVSSDETTPTHA